MAAVETTTTLILVAGAAVAGFVQGLSGFAFGMVSTAIWAWWLPPQLVAPMAVFGALTGQVIAAVTTRRALQWPRLAPLVLGGLAGMPVGLWLLPRLDTAWFQFFVGALLAVWCPLMLASNRLPQWRLRHRGADALAGAAGGFTGAVGGFTGALPTLWCTLNNWPKDELRSVVQNFNLVMLAATFVAYVASGAIGRQHLPYMAWVGPVLLIPVLAGARLYTGISPEAFRRLVLVLLAASGVALLARSVPVLLGRIG
jgi:uncharacterized protein